ncbi:MAG: hypothetical protein ACRD2Z_10925 [Thermoanaerobaculia bacterium]
MVLDTMYRQQLVGAPKRYNPGQRAAASIHTLAAGYAIAGAAAK